MKELFVLAWHSYEPVDEKLDGCVLGVYPEEEAKERMCLAAQDTIDFNHQTGQKITVMSNEESVLIQGTEGYEVCYFIEKVTIPEPKETKYKEALMQISKLGSVSSDFELCKHKACTDSAGAVLIALEALKDV